MNNVLVGKVIKSISLSDDQGAIKFELEDGSSVVAVCDADCCSNTWIEDVINPEAAIDAEVIGADDVELPEHLTQKTTTDNYEEEMAYYGFEIRTAKGTFLIAYRNSSNGYYGGRLAWSGDYSHSNCTNAIWKQVA